jgi:hypothetical protein
VREIDQSHRTDVTLAPGEDSRGVRAQVVLARLREEAQAQSGSAEQRPMQRVMRSLM